jgi:hypothetical protein
VAPLRRSDPTVLRSASAICACELMAILNLTSPQSSSELSVGIFPYLAGGHQELASIQLELAAFLRLPLRLHIDTSLRGVRAMSPALIG